MSTKEILKFRVTSCYISALIAGDYTGLQNFEVDDITAFEGALPTGYFCNPSHKYDDFSYCDVSKKFASCATIEYLITHNEFKTQFNQPNPYR